MIATDDSLTQGLRTLALLAWQGPLDLGRLADLNGGALERAAAVLDVLQDAGLVYRTAGTAGFAVTPRAAALVGAPPVVLH